MARRTTLRPEEEGDREFLFALYASTRAAEMAMVPWSAEEKESFLRFQFEAQTTHYRQHFKSASFDIIELGGVPVGRLYVDRRVDEIRLVDIALAPPSRGLGLGSDLLAELLAEGQREGLVVRIHVEHNNPAMRLYRRLGFEKIEEQGVYWLMEWTPETRRRAEE